MVKSTTLLILILAQFLPTLIKCDELASVSWVRGEKDSRKSTYGPMGNFSTDTLPGRRTSGVGYQITPDLYYFFGGSGIGTDSSYDIGYYSHGIIYSHSQKMYKLNDGNLQFGDLGQQGVHPGCRTMAMLLKWDTNSFVLHAGSCSGYNGYNDVWIGSYEDGEVEWNWVYGASGVYESKGLFTTCSCPKGKRGVGGVKLNNNEFVVGFGTTSGGWQHNDWWKWSFVENKWMWISGSSGVNQVGVYGEIGVKDASNVIGARYSPSMMVHPNGTTVFVFGGVGCDEGEYCGMSGRYLNDMWSYDDITQLWAWEKGNKTNQPFSVVFNEELEVFHEKNIPSPRSASSLVKLSDDSYLIFGGYGRLFQHFVVKNDMWVFNMSSMNFKMIFGEINEVMYTNYDENNTVLGGRANSHVFMLDSDNLILFYGYGYDDTNSIMQNNDIFEFNMITKKFKFIMGDRTTGTSSIYHLQGNFSKENSPGKRASICHWSVSETQTLFYGGFGFAGNRSMGIVEDMFLYDSDKNEYNWIGGPKSIRLDNSTNNPEIPIGRSASSFTSIDSCEHLLFGGIIHHPDLSVSMFDDIWIFDVCRNKKWRFLTGTNLTNTISVESVVGNYDENNRIGARQYSIVFVFDDEIVIAFGSGMGNTHFGDLWSFNFRNSKTWRRISGDINGCNNDCVGEFGTRGVPSIDVYPSPRFAPFKWKMEGDGNSGFFIFGGSCLGQRCYLSDMMFYSWESALWTWVNGENSTKPAGSYGHHSVIGYTKVYTDEYKPGGRGYGVSGRITRDSLFLFGGIGFDCCHGYEGHLADMWIYNITRNQFKFVFGEYSGRSSRSEYETLGETSFSTVIGSRYDFFAQYSSVYDRFVAGFGYTPGGVSNNVFVFYPIHRFCNGISSDDERVCNNGRGYCVDTDLCECHKPEVHSGNFCVHMCEQIPASSEDSCTGHGKCIEDPGNNSTFYRTLCICDDNYGTPEGHKQCSEHKCNGVLMSSPDVCHSHGSCHYSEEDYRFFCYCDEKWSGNNCDIFSCFGISRNDSSACGGFLCVKLDVCECPYPYSGRECEKKGVHYRDVVLAFSIIFGVIILFLFILICILSMVLLSRNRIITTLKKVQAASKLENVEILLEEQEVTRGSNAYIPKIMKEKFEISFESLEIQDKIGEGGSNSVVYRALWENNEVCFKAFKKEFVTSEKQFEEFTREVKILMTLSHPSILQFYGACLKGNRIGIVCEYCVNGDLKSFLGTYKMKNEMSYPYEQKLRMFKEILAGVSHIHSKGIIHRDIKPENILVDKNHSVKLMDFGISKIVEDMLNDVTQTKRVGTSCYMAPQVTLSGRYSEKCDVFSLAIVFYAVISEQFSPYRDEGQFQIILNLHLKVANEPEFRPNIDSSTTLSKFRDQWLIDLIKKMWSHEEIHRPAVEDILKIFEEKAKSDVEKGGEVKIFKVRRLVKEMTKEELEKEVKSLRMENELLLKKLGEFAVEIDTL